MDFSSINCTAVNAAWYDYQKGQCSRHSTHPEGNLNETWSLVVLNSYQPYNWFNFIVRRKERNLPTERPSFVVSDEMRPENSLQECGGVSSGGIDKLIDNLFWECTTVIIPCPLVITLRGKLSSR